MMMMMKMNEEEKERGNLKRHVWPVTKIDFH